MILRLLALAAMAAISLPSQTLNTNLIVNGDAESGPGASQPTAAQVSNVPGWTTSGGFSVGVNSPNFVESGTYGPANRGKQIFYGGPGAQRSAASQMVNLTALAANIDAGSVKFYLSGYLGFIAGSYDSIHAINLKAEFQDAAGNTLLTSIAYGPDPTEVNVPAGLFYRAATGFLPANVRKVKVTLDLASNSSGYNNYAADNLSLTLNTDPMMGANLLQDRDAETDPPSASPAPISGWNSDSFFTVWKWGDYRLPGAKDPGPADRGAYFFSCPTNHAVCKAFQTVDFTTAKALVDAGKVTFQMSGWLGGDSVLPDYAAMNVTFYDSAGAALKGGTFDIGPVQLQDRNSQMGMWLRSAGAAVPAGSRSAQVTLIFTKLGPPTDNLYAYADNLAFELDSIQITSVVNAASSLAGPVAPGEFVTVYGTSLGPSSGVSGMQKGLGNAHATFNGIEAYLTYSSAGQINALVPYGVATKADVVVQYNGNTSAAFPLTVAAAAPGIFTQQYGTGQVWAVNNDYTFNAANNPVLRGQWIEFWATGQGAVSPDGQDGEVPPATGKEIVQPVKLTIGGIEAQVFWKALVYTGEIQVNAWVPASISAGNVEVILTVGSASSRPGVTLAVK